MQGGGLTGLNPPPKFFQKNHSFIQIGTFYALQFAQESQFNNHFTRIVFIDKMLKRDTDTEMELRCRPISVCYLLIYNLLSGSGARHNDLES